MFEGLHFLVFGAAALVLAVTPGPGMLYVLGRTVNAGRREGVLSSLGTFAGGSIHLLAAALGLSAILATSATAFQIVRYAGAAYLIYLGIAMIRSRNLAPQSATDKGEGGSGPSCRELRPRC
jgi:threonine/homoserine/homoserine lactone efflux protein